MHPHRILNYSIQYTCLFALLASLTLIGCSTNQNLRGSANNYAQTTENKELILKSKNQFNTVHINPNIDLRQYKSVFIKPLRFDTLKIIQPNNSVIHKPFELEEDYKDRIAALHFKAITEQFTQHPTLRLVNEPDQDTLIVESALTELQPNATNTANRPPSVRTKIYSEGSGSITITTTLTDTSNRVAASINTKKRSNEFWGQNNEISNLRDMTSMLNSWSRSLRAQIDSLMQR